MKKKDKDGLFIKEDLTTYEQMEEKIKNYSVEIEQSRENEMDKKI